MAHFVLVHGSGMGGWCWYKLAALLVEAGHRVTLPDLRASGIHNDDLGQVKNLASYLEPLMEVMASLPEDEKVVLVGHSYGGVAISLAMEKFPGKVVVAVFVTATMGGPLLSLLQVEEEVYWILFVENILLVGGHSIELSIFFSIP